MASPGDLADIQEELAQLRAQLADAQLEVEQLNADKETQATFLEAERTRVAAKSDYEAQLRFQAERDQADAKVQAARREVVQLKAAFNGETSGWEEARDPATGATVYKNTETGESTVDKPTVLRIAETMAKMQQKDTGEVEVVKYKRQTEEARTQQRNLQNVITELREELSVVKKLNLEWTRASPVVHQAMMAFKSNLDAKLETLESRTVYLADRISVAEDGNRKVCKVVPKVVAYVETIRRQAEEVRELTSQLRKLQDEHQALREKHKLLTQHFNDEVDKVVQPVQAEMARLQAMLQQARLEREQDRRDIASLWPSEHLMPSLLLKYKPITEEDRQELKRKVETADAELALREEIQKKLYEASRWSIQYDSYGREYYIHADTGETCWEQPEVVAYKVPVGRDRQGNKIDPNDAARVWVQHADTWGNAYYENVLTGETTYEKPEGLHALDQLKHKQAEMDKLEGNVDPELGASAAARIVVRFLKQRVQDKRGRSQEQSRLYDGIQEAAIAMQVDNPLQSEADEQDVSKWVYDIQQVEELAKGDEGWTFEQEEASKAAAEAARLSEAQQPKSLLGKTLPGTARQSASSPKMSPSPAQRTSLLQQQQQQAAEAGAKEQEAAKPFDLFAQVTTPELRGLLHRTAKREEQLEDMLAQVRKHLADMSIVMLERVKKEADERAAERRRWEEAQALVASRSSVTSDDDSSASGSGVASSKRASQREGGQATAANPQETAPAAEGSARSRGSASGHDSDGNAKGVGIFNSTLRTSRRKSTVAAAPPPQPEPVMPIQQPQVKEERSQASQPPPPPGDESVVPRSRASNDVVHALATQAIYSGFFNSGVEPVDIKTLSEVYGRGKGQTVELADEWLAACFFMHSAADETLPNASQSRCELGSEQGDERFLCLPLPFDDQPPQEQPPVQPEADPAELLRVRKRYEAQRDKKKKWTKEDQAAEDKAVLAEVRPPLVWSGHPLPPQPTLPQYLEHADQAPLTVALIAHEKLRREAHKVAIRQMSLLKRVQSGRVSQSELDAAGIRAVAGDDGSARDESTADGTNSRNAEHDRTETVVGSPEEYPYNRPRRHHERKHVRQQDNIRKLSAAEALELMRKEQTDKQRHIDEVILESLEEADPVLGVKTREWMQSPEQLSIRSKGIDSTDGQPDRPALLVGKIDALKSRCPEKELLHERKVHQKQLQPLLDEADRIRQTMHVTHFKLNTSIQAWRAEANDLIVKIGATVNTLNFSANEKFQNVKMLSVPLVEPKEPVMPLQGDSAFVRLAPNFDDRYRAGVSSNKYGEDEIEALSASIHAGAYDGREFVPTGSPEKKLGTVQLARVHKAVEARHRHMQTERDRAIQGYEEALRFHKEKVAEWRRKEQERQVKLKEAQCRCRVVNLMIDAELQKKTFLEKRIEDLNKEAESEARRWDWLCECERRSRIIRCKQVADKMRSDDAILCLQDELCKVLKLYDKARLLPRSALTDFERPQFEQESLQIIKSLEYPVTKLREQLVEEGRRLRYLLKEEVEIARIELERLRDEAANEQDMWELLDGIPRQVSDVFTAADDFKDAKVVVAETRYDVAGLQTEYQERYPHDWNWEYEGDDHLMYASYKFNLMFNTYRNQLAKRAARREREAQARARHVALCALQLPPPEEQWAARATAKRAEIELEIIKTTMHMEAIDLMEQLCHEKRKKVGVEQRIQAREDTMQAMVKSHEQEVAAIREVATSAFGMLKETTDRIKQEANNTIAAINADLKEVTAAYDELRVRYDEEVEGLKAKVVLYQNWIEALRVALNRESEKLSLTEEQATETKDRLRKEALSAKEELRVERGHANRVELWAGALIADMRRFEVEIKQREDVIVALKGEMKQADRDHKYKIWRKCVALQRLATDPSELFLFFIQRVANMAGSRKAYNDALRAHGGMAVIVALCQSPREEIRRCAAVALGNIMWDGYVEQRVVAWDVIRHWGSFEAMAVEDEELRVKQIAAGLHVQDGPEEQAQDTVTVWEDEYKPTVSMPLRQVVRSRRQWALRLARRKESPNLENQRTMGGDEGHIQLMLTLCRDVDKAIMRSAATALSLAAYCEDNADRMGRCPGCMETLMELCVGQDDQAVHAQAITAMANLVYCNPRNQESLAAVGAIEMLLGKLKTGDVDVLECATAAIANLVTCFEPNAMRIGKAGGVEILAGLMVSNQTANLLDSDQIEEIQANVAEALVNITKVQEAQGLREVLHAMGVRPFVLMCGSSNLQVLRHAPLIIGNLAQEDHHREALGENGAVEALFVLTEKHDDPLLQANALWALSNLAWNRNNADRIGRYYVELLRLCKTQWLPTQTNAVVCLANSLYYDDDNRRILEDIPDAIEAVMSWCEPAVPHPVAEAALRAMVSLCYPDRISCRLVVEHPELMRILMQQVTSECLEIQRQALRCITNLAVHDANKIRIADAGGIEALVTVHGSSDEKLRVMAAQVLELLADVKGPEEMMDRRIDMGIDGLLGLCTHQDEALQKLAVETLVDLVESKPEGQMELASKGGLDMFEQLVRESMSKSLHSPLLEPSLWALRNLAHNNRGIMSKMGRRGTLDVLLDVVKRTRGQPPLASTLEAALAALLVASLGHEANCRHLLNAGLDVLLSVAENYAINKEMAKTSPGKSRGTLLSKGALAVGRPGTVELPAWPPHKQVDWSLYNRYEDDLPPTTKTVPSADHEIERNCVALAVSILQLLGPYSYMLCTACGHKEKGGAQCSKCGQQLRVNDDVDDGPSARSSASSKLRKSVQPQSSLRGIKKLPVRASAPAVASSYSQNV